MSAYSTILIVVIDKSNGQIQQYLLRLVQEYLDNSRDVTVIHAEDLDKTVILTTRPDKDGMRKAFCAGMTERQKQVTQMVLNGLTNKEIAKQLQVVPGVVAARLTEVYDLLEAISSDGTHFRPNRQGLIAFFGDFFERYRS